MRGHTGGPVGGAHARRELLRTGGDGLGFRILLLMASLIPLAGGCTIGRAPSAMSHEVRPDLPTTATYSPNTVISGAELAVLDAPNLYQAIRRLRPGILRAGPPSALPQGPALPVVFLDDHLLGDVNELQRMNHVGVREIRRLSRVDLAIRYGRGDLGSAILILTR